MNKELSLSTTERIRNRYIGNDGYSKLYLMCLHEIRVRESSFEGLGFSLCVRSNASFAGLILMYNSTTTNHSRPRCSISMQSCLTSQNLRSCNVFPVNEILYGLTRNRNHFCRRFQLQLRLLLTNILYGSRSLTRKLKA